MGRIAWEPGAPALALRNVNKQFGETRVLRDVSFEIPTGKVVALLGENGSGKSTIIKVISGFYDATPGGYVAVGGHELAFPITPVQGHDAGVRFVHQDLGLVESMSIFDNVCFAVGFGNLRGGAIREKDARVRVRSRLERLGLDWDLDARVGDLSPAQRTMLAIARVLGDPGDTAPRMLILDEPTASLPASEVEHVFAAIERVAADGGSVLYVSHRIDEVLRIADELVVLRDGQIVTQRSTEGITHEEIVSLLLGRELAATMPQRGEQAPSQRNTHEPIITVRGLTGSRLTSLDLDIKPGEILGIAGLAGCGRSELVRILAGAQRPQAGEMTYSGNPYAPRSARAAIRSGITYVPEDRRNHGCVGPLSVQQNLTLLDLRPLGSAFWLSKRAERKEARRLIEQFDIRPSDPLRPISKLSGGNQQKAVLAKTLRVTPKVILLDEPTQGIDIGARAEIASLVIRLAGEGLAVVLASSDAAELAALCDRLIVLDRGHLKTEIRRPHISEERLALAISGANVPDAA